MTIREDIKLQLEQSWDALSQIGAERIAIEHLHNAVSKLADHVTKSQPDNEDAQDILKTNPMLRFVSTMEFSLDDWRRQDEELESARRGLEECDRNSGQERQEDQKILAARTREIAKVAKEIFGVNIEAAHELAIQLNEATAHLEDSLSAGDCNHVDEKLIARCRAAILKATQ